MTSTKPYEFKDDSWKIALAAFALLAVVVSFGIMFYKASAKDKAEVESQTEQSIPEKIQKADVEDYFVTSWGSHFLVDKNKVDEISLELKSCLNDLTFVCGKCDGQFEPTVEELASAVLECDNDYYSRIRIRQEPPTFYSYPLSEADPYEEFWMCVHALSAPYDVYHGADVIDVKNAILECLKYYPEQDGDAA